MVRWQQWSRDGKVATVGQMVRLRQWSRDGKVATVGQMVRVAAVEQGW